MSNVNVEAIEVLNVKPDSVKLSSTVDIGISTQLSAVLSVFPEGSRLIKLAVEENKSGVKLLVLTIEDGDTKKPVTVPAFDCNDDEYTINLVASTIQSLDARDVRGIAVGHSLNGLVWLVTDDHFGYLVTILLKEFGEDLKIKADEGNLQIVVSSKGEPVTSLSFENKTDLALATEVLQSQMDFKPKEKAMGVFLEGGTSDINFAMNKDAFDKHIAAFENYGFSAISQEGYVLYQCDEYKNYTVLFMLSAHEADREMGESMCTMRLAESIYLPGNAKSLMSEIRNMVSNME